MQTPLAVLFYEDAVNDEIIQETVDAELKNLLDDLRENRFKNIGKCKEQVLELVKKGILIYR